MIATTCNSWKVQLSLVYKLHIYIHIIAKEVYHEGSSLDDEKCKECTGNHQPEYLLNWTLCLIVVLYAMCCGVLFESPPDHICRYVFIALSLEIIWF